MADPKAVKRAAKGFDPEGTGYDSLAAAELIKEGPLTIPKPQGPPRKGESHYVTQPGAFQAWVWHPEENDWFKHSGSIDYRSGQVLKGRSHKTFPRTQHGENSLGNWIYQGPDGKYYSRKLGN